MKRKFSQINNELVIQPIPYLKCEVCKRKVYTYQVCTGNHIYCSEDCYEVLILSKKNGYLDEKTQKQPFDEIELMIID